MGMSAINELLNMGADAYKNIYDVLITFPKGFQKDLLAVDSSTDRETNPLQVSVRCNEFAIPKYATGEAERKYKGVTIKTPKPEEDFTREFDLTFRMDASYGLYEKFCKWQGKVVGPNGEVSNWMRYLGKVQIAAACGEYLASNKDTNRIFEENKAIGANNAINTSGTDFFGSDTNNAEYGSQFWSFDNVWVSEVGKPEFSNSDSGEITYSVKFNFSNSEYGTTDIPDALAGSGE